MKLSFIITLSPLSVLIPIPNSIDYFLRVLFTFYKFFHLLQPLGNPLPIAIRSARNCISHCLFFILADSQTSFCASTKNQRDTLDHPYNVPKDSYHIVHLQVS